MIEGVKKGANQLLDQFRVSLGDWLWAMLNWPTPDWREQLNRFVEHTRYYGLIIEPESIRTIHDLVEARVNGTGPFAALGPYGGPQPAGTGPTVQLAMSVGLDDSTRSDASVDLTSGPTPTMKDGAEVAGPGPETTKSFQEKVQTVPRNATAPGEVAGYKLGWDPPTNEHPLKSTWGHDKEQLTNPLLAQVYSRIAIDYLQRGWLTLKAGQFLGFANAAEQFKHFLANTGTARDIDFRAMNHNNRRAYDNMVRSLNAALVAAEEFAVDPRPGATIEIVTSRETRQPAIHDGSDWEYAISGYRTWARGVVSRSGGKLHLTWEYRLRDVYQFGTESGTGSILVK